MKFTYSNPTRIFFGQGQIAAINEALPAHSKVLFAYGGGSIKKNGVYDQVVAALAKHSVVEFSGIEPNPTKETLDKAVALVREQKIDFILAVGGGSVADGCKYIAASALYDSDGWDILEGKYTINKALPLGVILTLPATGSESNGNAVITRKATTEKRAFSSTFTYPVFAVLDPDTMISLPKRQLINGIGDAFVHICEQYLTYPVGAKVQDGYAEVLLRNLVALGRSFDQYDESPQSNAWRETLMWTANQALNGLIGLSVPNDWATHNLGHALTAYFGIDHACTLTIVQPSLLRDQLNNKKDKLEQMGINVFNLPQSPDLAQKTIETIESFYQSIGLPTQFNDYGVKGMTKEQAVDTLVAQLKHHGATAEGERQSITLEHSRAIYNAALK